MQLSDIRNEIAHHTGRSRIVLEYSQVVARVMASAGDPDFSLESWAPLAALLDTERFERVGNFREVMDWSEYARFLTLWAPSGSWECSFRRVSEVGDLVFLELEERTTTGGVTNVVNSLSVYAFGSDDRIWHVDVYLQMPIPREFLPEAYAGVRLLD